MNNPQNPDWFKLWGAALFSDRSTTPAKIIVMSAPTMELMPPEIYLLAVDAQNQVTYSITLDSRQMTVDLIKQLEDHLKITFPERGQGQ